MLIPKRKYSFEQKTDVCKINFFLLSFYFQYHIVGQLTPRFLWRVSWCDFQIRVLSSGLEPPTRTEGFRGCTPSSCTTTTLEGLKQFKSFQSSFVAKKVSDSLPGILRLGTWLDLWSTLKMDYWTTKIESWNILMLAKNFLIL